MVAHIKRNLEKRGHACEQKHQWNVKEDWFKYWTYLAEQADVVVIFDSQDEDDDGLSYYDSAACKKEKSWCTRNKKGGYICVGPLVDDDWTSEEIAIHIDEKMGR